MTDHTSPHLTDDALNEYLDEALPPQGRATADAHLATCAACSTRLENLRALFAGLGALPDAPLTRDLAPAVIRAVQPRLAPPVPARRPWLTLVVVAQLLITVAALAIAWPFVAAQFGTLAGSAVPLSVWLNDLTASVLALAGAFPPPAQLWSALQDSAQASWAGLVPAFTNAIPAQFLIAVAAAAGLLWLLTNVWLLRQRPNGSLRRTL